VTISIILVLFQIDAGSLIQILKKNEKALRKIQERIMRARNLIIFLVEIYFQAEYVISIRKLCDCMILSYELHYVT